MNARFYLPIMAIVLGMSFISTVCSATTAEKAAQLKSTLTPFGAERTGNADGSIPAWDGGYTTPIPGTVPGQSAPDPFAADKPLFSITANNMALYADKLTDGTKALLKKYPDTFRVDVFPTHRTAAAPQEVYDGTFANATRCRLLDGGDTGLIPEAKFCAGGVPFPIPNNGSEAMWNHQLGWQGHAVRNELYILLLTPDRKVVELAKTNNWDVRPNYDNVGATSPWDGSVMYFLNKFVGPATRVGELQIIRSNVDQDNSKGWLYFPGQRRTRQLPNPCCDTPNSAALGQQTIDEVNVFIGTLARYDWKLVGKQEIYVPYNGNRYLHVPTEESLFNGGNLNPDWLRWELHRVWVVEANLRPGKRHVYPKGRFYLDEDSWQALLSDRYDSRGELWKVGFQILAVLPEGPAVRSIGNLTYDLFSGSLLIGGAFVGIKDPVKFIDRKDAPDSLFTPEAMASEGVR